MKTSIIDFSNSKYSQFLLPEIEIIRDYQQKISGKLNDQINFIADTENINSLKELISLYKGKNLYIDVWKTTCVPCKEEFKHAKELKVMLKQHDIQPLYISFDEVYSKKNCPDMIKYYNLEGDHIINNDTFHTDLFKEYQGDGGVAVPWYMIVNKKGEIVVRHAKRPSDKSELEKQLISVLNL